MLKFITVENKEAAQRINEAARELAGRNGLSYDFFSAVHQLPECVLTKEEGVVRADVSKGLKKDFPVKWQVCHTHGVISGWVYRDY